MSASPRLPNFVIGGTEKAGTTSVFDWLSVHPQVCASTRKETDFFREDFSGDLHLDRLRYASYFERCAGDRPVVMEASPGYLGEAAVVAPRMRLLTPGTRLLFILRDPIDRLYSSYHFHRGKLNLPQELSFEDYVDRCLRFERQGVSPAELGLDEWYLKVLRFGSYADFIAIYRSKLPVRNIKVMFFESLRHDARAFMTELSAFVGIDQGFWEEFEFRKSNVTFSARLKGLHRIAMLANRAAEPVLRRYPGIKQSLVSTYKSFNQEREGYEPMPAAVRSRLVEYYAPGVHALRRQLGVRLPASWNYFMRVKVAA